MGVSGLSSFEPGIQAAVRELEMVSIDVAMRWLANVVPDVDASQAAVSVLLL